MSLTFENIISKAEEKAKSTGPRKLVLIGGGDGNAAAAVDAAADRGWIEPISAVVDNGNHYQNDKVVKAKNFSDLVQKSVKAASEQGALLMKGDIDEQVLLGALLNEDSGFLLPRKQVSHIGFFQPEKLGRMLLVTDGVVVENPTLEVKLAMVQNSIAAAEALGLEKPKVALLSAVEAVYLQMQPGLDGAVLAKMSDRGVFKGAVVDGPLSFDVALVPEAAQAKKVKGEVAGYADILVTPYIEVGNGLCKSLFMFCNSPSAGILYGGKIPLCYNFRLESADSHLNSIAIGMMLG